MEGHSQGRQVGFGATKSHCRGTPARRSFQQHGKAGGAEDAGAAMQIGRDDHGRFVPDASKFAGSKNDGTPVEFAKERGRERLPGSGYTATHNVQREIQSIDQIA